MICCNCNAPANLLALTRYFKTFLFLTALPLSVLQCQTPQSLHAYVHVLKPRYKLTDYIHPFISGPIKMLIQLNHSVMQLWFHQQQCCVRVHGNLNIQISN